jgi:outer membrane protein
MKNRSTALILFLAVLGVPHVARAQGKVGVINMNAAIAGTVEGKQAIVDLKKKYEPKQQDLERLQKEIQADQDQLSKAGLSDNDQRRLSRELDEKQKEFKRWSDDAQSDFGADRDEAINRIGKKMVAVISDYAQKNGFTLVIDAVQVPIFFASKDVDITAEMIKRYDAANPAAAAATPTKPAATAASATKHR